MILVWTSVSAFHQRFPTGLTISAALVFALNTITTVLLAGQMNIHSGSSSTLCWAVSMKCAELCVGVVESAPPPFPAPRARPAAPAPRRPDGGGAPCRPPTPLSAGSSWRLCGRSSMRVALGIVFAGKTERHVGGKMRLRRDFSSGEIFGKPFNRARRVPWQVLAGRWPRCRV